MKLTTMVEFPYRETPIVNKRYGEDVMELPSLNRMRHIETMCSRCRKNANCSAQSEFWEMFKKHKALTIVTCCRDFSPLHEPDDE